MVSRKRKLEKNLFDFGFKAKSAFFDQYLSVIENYVYLVPLFDSVLLTKDLPIYTAAPIL